MAIASLPDATAPSPHFIPAACTAADESTIPTATTATAMVLLDLDLPWAVLISDTATHALAASLQTTL
nr:hypothetical protein [Neisseria elongata]